MTYHSGSRAIQDRVGVRDLADHMGRAVGRGIRPVAAAFLELQPMLVVGAVAPESGAGAGGGASGRGAESGAEPGRGAGAGGRAPENGAEPGSHAETGAELGRGVESGVESGKGVETGAEPGRGVGSEGGAAPGGGDVWVSLLTGRPGFLRATGPHQLSVVGGLPAGDPLTAALATPGTLVGTIALDPRTRRRMRLGGRVRPTPRGFAVEADRVFANCPKYLQKRETYETVADRAAGVPRRGRELTASQRQFVEAADTFFLATVHANGADASHRGGNPGFVHVDTPGELSWRDYPGNSMFLSLGNLAADPRAGLLFLDWTSGAVLQLTGTARTEFAPDGERTVRFILTEAVETPGASPLRWSAPAYSPANP
ncbi:pyridoxamine 5'-phosphate oxidase family protein [Streptomyces rhizosphaerihabitans]|uniref:pyridoxamine 5'-phosphate oxidase family protein n=1 Tax=Streptomyces rhizosphaerihabitans TaxID=1266770 RepID=UPI0028F70D92|nr:pyridoxamine 5'-phosphate oxidase family protein [Streptomyces rhizosphaerihabitans]